MKKDKTIIALVSAACVLLLAIPTYWGFSVARIQILTCWKGHEFAELYQGNTMLDEIESFKVLYCSAQNATVYYVSEDGESGDVLEFSKHNGRWVCKSWETVWSKHGSADGFVWPYLLDRWLT